MLRFITQRPLWFNILVGILLAILILAIFMFSLKWITHHGSARTVPDVMGKSYDEAREQLRSMGFDIEIQDSIFVDTVGPLVVLKQFPEADANVKVNRRVFLTISRAVPPMVEMPNLMGYSIRSAEMVLKNMNLRIGDTTFKPDFAKNSILEQSIRPGTKLPMGTRVDLVLGDGLGKQEYAVPVLVGLRLLEAKMRLEGSGLILGAIIPMGEITDTMNSYISRQNPQRFDEFGKVQRIRPGQMMDVWIQMEPPVIDTTNNSIDNLPLP
jgi:beta-lactam-binding protein with PASTA domain